MEYSEVYGQSRSGCMVLRRDENGMTVIYANAPALKLAQCTVVPEPVQVFFGAMPSGFFSRLEEAAQQPGVDGWTLFLGPEHTEFSFTVLPLEGNTRLLTISQDSVAVETLRQILDSSRQELQSALAGAQEANEAKSRFLSNMSHDIRTPLNAILGMTDIALAHTDSPERMTDCLLKVRQASGHLLSLVNNVLDMSRIESGRLELNPQQFLLGALLAELRTIVLPTAQKKGLQFRIVCTNITHEIFRGDDTRIRQVLINLLGNAVKFTERGSVTLSLQEECPPWREESMLTFRVTDTGMGMDEAFQKKLFTPFERADAAWEQHIEGTGLGMSISRQLVQMMGGTIQVESQLGKGTKIDVTLPLLPVQQEATQAALLYMGQGVLLWNRVGLCPEIEDFLAAEGLFCSEEIDAPRLIAQARSLEAQDNLWGLIADADQLDERLTQTLTRFKTAFGQDFPILVLTGADGPDAFAGADGVLHWPLYRVECHRLLAQLSRRQDAATQSRPLTSIQSPLRDYSAYKLLLVEDNQLNMEIALEFLSETGVRIDTAQNGREAVEKFAQSAVGEYRLIFMDIQMPVMDGYEATRRIRAMNRPDAKTVGIVAMSANAFAEDVQKSLHSGMNQHLCKPLEMDKVYEVMSRFFNAARG